MMRCTFSVMFSIVRFLSSGTDAVPGPVAEAAMVMCGGVEEKELVKMGSQARGGRKRKRKR